MCIVLRQGQYINETNGSFDIFAMKGLEEWAAYRLPL